MLKIGIECHNLEKNRWGIGRHLSKILEEISKKPELEKEFRFYLYFKSAIPNDPYLASPIFVKKILRFPFLRPSFNIFFHLLLPFAYWRDRLNAMFFASFMLPAFFVGKSLVVLTNDIHYEYTKGSLPWRYRLAYPIFSNWAARRATRLTTYTETAKKEIVKLFKVKPEKIMVNYLGVQENKFPVNAENSAKENYILHVGQAFPRRRAKETIEAFATIAPKFPELKLVMVGEDKYNPPMLDELIAQTNRSLGENKIIRYDYVDDEKLNSLYSKAKLFIYASTSEAMGLPPLEALAAGTPPIVKDNDLNREIYEGRAFYVNDEKDPAEIAQAIEKALTDSAKYRGILDYSPKILSKFSWQKHTERFLEILKNICSAR